MSCAILLYMIIKVMWPIFSLELETPVRNASIENVAATHCRSFCYACLTQFVWRIFFLHNKVVLYQSFTLILNAFKLRLIINALLSIHAGQINRCFRTICLMIYFFEIGEVLLVLRSILSNEATNFFSKQKSLAIIMIACFLSENR